MTTAAVVAAMVHITFGNIVAVGGIVSLLIVAASLVGTSFRTSRNTTTLANYREAAQSWELKSSAQEDEIGDLQAKVGKLEDALAQKDRQIIVLQEQISGLRELLLQRAAFETLQEKMAEALVLGAENRTLLKENQAALQKLVASGER